MRWKSEIFCYEWWRRDVRKGVSRDPKVLKKHLDHRVGEGGGKMCSCFDLPLHKPFASSWGKLKGKLFSLFQRDKLSFFTSKCVNSSSPFASLACPPSLLSFSLYQTNKKSNPTAIGSLVNLYLSNDSNNQWLFWILCTMELLLFFVVPEFHSYIVHTPTLNTQSNRNSKN